MTVWRDDPDLKGRFHPEYPDDLQVMAHEGSFRFTTSQPEIVWVRIGVMLEGKFDDGSTLRYYRANLLNQPHQLKTLTVGQEILFMIHKGYKYGVLVTYEYLQDRAEYIITPCNRCGMPELFDPISKLHQKSFPDMKKDNPDLPPDTLSIFTSFCPICGPNGFLIVRDKRIGEDSVDKMLSEAYASIQKSPTNKPTYPGHSASKQQNAAPSPQNENLFSKFKNGLVVLKDSGHISR